MRLNDKTGVYRINEPVWTGTRKGLFKGSPALSGGVNNLLYCKTALLRLHYKLYSIWPTLQAQFDELYLAPYSHGWHDFLYSDFLILTPGYGCPR